MKTNKLTLKKEKVASLTNRDMVNVVGGKPKSGLSSAHPKFTCCWCSFGNTAPKNCDKKVKKLLK